MPKYKVQISVSGELVEDTFTAKDASELPALVRGEYKGSLVSWEALDGDDDEKLTGTALADAIKEAGASGMSADEKREAVTEAQASPKDDSDSSGDADPTD